MDYEPLTLEKRDRILDDNATTLMRRILIGPYFMAELVKEKVMDNYHSQEIQAEQTPGKKKNALLIHLQTASIEQFISFCIVLEVNQKRRDIVRDQFGLKLKDLICQRDDIRRNAMRESTQSRARPIAYQPADNTVPRHRPLLRQPSDGDGQKQGQQPAEEEDDEVDKSVTEDVMKALWRSEPTGARYVPNIPPEPSHTLETDNNASAIVSLSGNMESIKIKEFQMLHDPTEETELNSTKLGSNWMTAEFIRLKESLVGKRHKPVVIALLDSGVFTDHPDLNDIGLVIKNRNCIGSYSRNGRFFPDVEEEKDLMHDKVNHGTMSAGILWQCAGEENVKIVNLKVMRCDGRGSFQYVSEALNYIKTWDADHPDIQVDIILMTLGGSQEDSETDELLSELGGKKILICSASNDGQTKANAVMSPANHGSVIAIGSCNRNGDRCSHSSVGQELDFLFPGEEIQSTSSKYRRSKPDSRYTQKSGTSFAAPYSAALVALVLCYVETHITSLNGADGRYWRKVLTKSSEMKKLLREVCCRREHSYEKGFGAPELDRIRKDGIQAHLKWAFKISD